MPKFPFTLEKFHPFIGAILRTPAEHIAALNSSLPFVIPHISASKHITEYDTSQIFSKNANVIFPPNVTDLWKVVECNQSMQLGVPLADSGVTTGLASTMQEAFPNHIFHSNQKYADVYQNFEKTLFEFKGQVGTDFKNAMGKTQPHGRNQVIIGTLEKYQEVLKAYNAEIALRYNCPEIKLVVQNLLVLAKENNFSEQVKLLACNIHKFPEKWNPPLYSSKKFPYDHLTPEIKLEIDKATRYFRLLSKQAYLKQVPEDHFDQSHIQKLLGEVSEAVLNDN